jgi:sugar O-acyltransferase (sialic acid O-acetyltransferase NeuD family)
MKKIAIIGAGGLGMEIADLIRAIGGYELVGFFDDNRSKQGGMINHLPVLGTISELRQSTPLDCIVIAIANPGLKQAIYDATKHYELEYPNLIHPSVILGSNVSMGIGTIICANTIISTNVKLHDFVTINPQCGIGHEGELHSFSSLYWNVHLGGNTTIGPGCELGTSSTIIQGLSVTQRVILGAGAVVVRDILDEGTYVGVPAKKIK